MTMTMTYKKDPYKKGFGPFAPDVHCLPYPAEGIELNYNDVSFNPEHIACAVVLYQLPNQDCLH